MLLSTTCNYCDGFDHQLYIVFVNDAVNCICTLDNINRVLMHFTVYTESTVPYSLWKNIDELISSFNEWNLNGDNLICDWIHDNIRISKPRMRQ